MEQETPAPPEQLPVGDAERLQAIAEGRPLGLGTAANGYISIRSANRDREQAAVQRRYKAPEPGAQTTNNEDAIGVQI
jgi:hypothetical protein